MNHYERETKNYPLLTPEQVVELSNRAQLGDQSARDLLILSNLRLVLKAVNRYTRYGDLDDLVQIGNLGLMKAIETYDPNKINPKTGEPYAFSTYAFWRIRAFILRSMDNDGTVRVPVYMRDLQRRILMVREEYAQETGRKPSIQEIVDKLNSNGHKRYSLKQVEKAVGFYNTQPVSLSKPMGEEGGDSLEDFIRDENREGPEQLVVRSDARTNVLRALQKLKPMEERVLKLKFGLNGDGPLDNEDIGLFYLGVTRVRVGQIEKKALAKLKKSKHLL